MSKRTWIIIGVIVLLIIITIVIVYFYNKNKKKNISNNVSSEPENIASEVDTAEVDIAKDEPIFVVQTD